MSRAPESLGLLRLCAADATALAAAARALAQRLRDGEAASFAAPIGTGACRFARVIGGRDEAVAALEGVAAAAPIADPAIAVSATMVPAAAAFLFPGLGEEYVGMAGGLLRRFAGFRALVERADALVGARIGSSLATYLEIERAPASPSVRPKLLLPRRGAEAMAPERVVLTHTTLFVVEYALARLWIELGCTPAALLGYSLGELTAAAVGGALGFDAALAFVVARAELVERLPAGAMLAVPLAPDELATLLPDEVYIAAHNAPAVCVASGTAVGIAALEARLRERAIAAQTLRAGYPFHTPLMAPIAADVERLAARLDFAPLAIPCVSTLTGGWLTDAQCCDPAHWARQLCEPVRFADAARTLEAARPSVIAELGPGQSLVSNLALAARSPAPTLVAALPSRRDLRPDLGQLLAALGSAWCRGIEIAALPDLHASTAPVRIGADGPVDAVLLEQIRAAWAELLELPAVQADDNFFDLGGNSLKAARIVNRLAPLIGARMPLRAFFEHPTPRAQALCLHRRFDSAAQSGAFVPRRTRLPNGMTVWNGSTAELEHFYADIFEHRGYLRGGIALPHDACVLDVGANIGLFSLFVASHCPGARIVAFEPSPKTFQLLERNVREHAARCTTVNLGVSDRVGDATLTFYPNSSGMSSLQADEAEERDVLRTILRNQAALGDARVGQVLENEAEFLDLRFLKEEVRCGLTTISAALREHQIARVDLLKIDVQKAELDVLRGIDDADWPRIAQVALEVHDLDARLEAVCALLARQGFSAIVEQDELYRGSPLYMVYATRAPTPAVQRRACVPSPVERVE